MNSVEAFNALEVVPVVTYDINLGQITSNIDFDYVAYDERLREAELTDNEIGSLTVHHFALSKNVHTVGGVYAPELNIIRLGVGLEMDESDLNNSLAHESHHMIEFLKGVVTLSSVLKRANTRGAFQATAMAAVFSGVAEEVYGIAASNEAFEIVGGAFLLLAVASYLHSLKLYFSNPMEKRAYEAGSIGSSDNIISYIGKKDGQPYTASDKEDDPHIGSSVIHIGGYLVTISYPKLWKRK